MCCLQVADLMASELGWSHAKKKQQIEQAHNYLKNFTVV